jgi:hypothetical protein
MQWSDDITLWWRGLRLLRGRSAYPPILSVNADIPIPQPSANSGSLSNRSKTASHFANGPVKSVADLPIGA